MEQYGLIGRPVGHSLSPRLHRLLYEQTGRQAEYGRFDVAPEHIGAALPALRALGIRGVNVTSPHKQAILPFLDELSPTAGAVGAVNTVLLREDGSAYGDNTDGYGFARGLLHVGAAITSRRFVLCGRSGSAEAVRHALEQEGAAEVLVASTDPAKGISYGELRHMEPRDVIVNCTPLGMHPNEDRSVVDEEVLRRFETAADLIYNPPETLFLRRAAALGLRTMNGLWMLIFQGIRSFEIWTGADTSGIDADAIYADLEKQLREGVPV